MTVHVYFRARKRQKYRQIVRYCKMPYEREREEGTDEKYMEPAS